MVAFAQEQSSAANKQSFLHPHKMKNLLLPGRFENMFTAVGVTEYS